MFTQILSKILSVFFFVALHVAKNGSFPPPLSKAEEQELLQKASAGDINARNKLVEHNLRLVAHITKKYTGNADNDDLISIGTIGLIKGISTFDTTKGSRLATYAARCIENEILMHFRASKKTAQDVSFNDPIDTDKDGNMLTLGDIVSCDGDIAEEISTKLSIEKLKKIFPVVLDKREREILILRFGLGGQEELTQQEIAKKLSISRSYVSRIEKAALKKLRPYF
ncbi:MAG: RNA polymerase sporulation sigma factor SigK [Acutalibacteraceae bacterium]|nr:RNA polymerase sporulation sigma factor SigK [Acutalibacteraceae bacterium]